MVHLIGYGWSDLYNQVKKLQKKALEIPTIMIIQTTYAGFPNLYDQTYAVVIRLGWEVSYGGGTVGGLTREQWAFIHCSTPKPQAILSVGEKWTSLEDAIDKAIMNLVRVDRRCIYEQIEKLKKLEKELGWR